MAADPMEFFVYSRPAIERVPAHDVPHVIISITTTADDEARIPPSPQCRATLRLVFLDADQPGDGFPESALFSNEHADRVWNFVLDHRPHIARIILHCDAGVSRSPGVAAALAKVLVGDDSEFFNRYHPNRRVYTTLLSRYRERFGERE